MNLFEYFLFNIFLLASVAVHGKKLKYPVISKMGKTKLFSIWLPYEEDFLASSAIKLEYFDFSAGCFEEESIIYLSLVNILNGDIKKLKCSVTGHFFMHGKNKNKGVLLISYEDLKKDEEEIHIMTQESEDNSFCNKVLRKENFEFDIVNDMLFLTVFRNPRGIVIQDYATFARNRKRFYFDYERISFRQNKFLI